MFDETVRTDVYSILSRAEENKSIRRRSYTCFKTIHSPIQWPADSWLPPSQDQAPVRPLHCYSCMPKFDEATRERKGKGGIGRR